MRMTQMCSQPIMTYHLMTYQPSSVLLLSELLLSVLICTVIIAVRENSSSKKISTFCFSDIEPSLLHYERTIPKNFSVYPPQSRTKQDTNKKILLIHHVYEGVIWSKNIFIHPEFTSLFGWGSPEI